MINAFPVPTTNGLQKQVEHVFEDAKPTELCPMTLPDVKFKMVDAKQEAESSLSSR